MASRRRDLRKILADPELRRELMVPTIQATQAREGIETTEAQAERAYYVVTEGERGAFFDLALFRGGKGQRDLRHESFVRAVSEDAFRVRFDIARRDFTAIEGAPLAFRRVGVVAHIFREAPSLEPAWGIARQGKATGDDDRWLRQWWEVGGRQDWVPFAKGGDYCRFYYDVDLVLNWREDHRADLKASGNALPSLEHYFKPGLTWPLRTQRGFNLRVMPPGCVFGHKGPAIFPSYVEDSFFLLGVANSTASDYLLRALTSFGSWEVGVIKRLPIPKPTEAQHQRIGDQAKSIHNIKADWDSGNEISTHFVSPWIVRDDLVERKLNVSTRLDRLAEYEAAKEAYITGVYDELNNEVYKLYGLPDRTRLIIEETLGNRPPEVLWPQMEGKSAEQKRMEHIWRLLSFAVKRVVEADDDGIVSFSPSAEETTLLDRVHRELQALFPQHDIGQVEVEISNELKKSVKGYRRTNSISEWLSNAFFEYHSSLYKNRPVIWHLASAQGTVPSAFGVLVHYHKFDRNRMGKLRGQYLRDAMETFRREAALAEKAGNTELRLEWQSKLEEAQTLDRRLQAIQEGHHEGPEGGDRDYRILTPWKSADRLPRGWDPDIDDGVKVNIQPLQKAGVLRVGKVV